MRSAAFTPGSGHPRPAKINRVAVTCQCGAVYRVDAGALDRVHCPDCQQIPDPKTQQQARPCA